MDKNSDDKWEIVLEHVALIEKMARIYYNSIISYENLYQEACLAVYDSIEDYDPNRGKSLSSFFISRIKYRYYELFASNKFEVFVPIAYCRQAFRLHRLQQKVKVCGGEYLTSEEAGKKLKISPKTIAIFEKLNRFMTRKATSSLSEFYDNDNELSAFDVSEGEFDLESRNINSYISDINIEEDIISEMVLEDALQSLECLKEKQKIAVLYHLGFMTGKAEPFRYIAEIIGGTAQNAHSHYMKGVQFLRKKILGNDV